MTSPHHIKGASPQQATAELIESLKEAGTLEALQTAFASTPNTPHFDVEDDGCTASSAIIDTVLRSVHTSTTQLVDAVCTALVGGDERPVTTLSLLPSSPLNVLEETYDGVPRQCLLGKGSPATT